MTPKTVRGLLALLAALVAAFALAACGSSDKSSSSSSSSGSSSSSSDAIKKDSANASKTITVGSKNFAEQYILGEIYAQALQAAGFKVKKQLDLGSEQVAYKAVKSGKISFYPEYTGTALTSFYRVKIDKVPRDKTESYNLLKKDAAAAGITALPQTPFQDTFVITSTKATKKKYGNATTVSQLKTKAGSKASISGFPECRQRTDCLLGLKNSYNWTPKFVSSQGKYADLTGGQADFTFGFGTDGELTLGKFATYKDDKKLFPPYYVTILANKKGISTLGADGQKVLLSVQKHLTVPVMQELNSRVTLDKKTPASAATAYLKQYGYIK